MLTEWSSQTSPGDFQESKTISVVQQVVEQLLVEANLHTIAILVVLWQRAGSSFVYPLVVDAVYSADSGLPQGSGRRKRNRKEILPGFHQIHKIHQIA